MKTVFRRIDRLEDQFGTVDGPRRRIRMIVRMAGAKPSLGDATCTRTLWPDGTLFEMVSFNRGNEGPNELTDEELDTWIESLAIS